MNILISSEINTFAGSFKDKLAEEVRKAKHASETSKWTAIGHSFFDDFTTKSRIALVNHIDKILTNINGEGKRGVNVPDLIDDIQYMCGNAIYMMKMAMEAFVMKLNAREAYTFDGQILTKLKDQNFENISQRDVRDVLNSMESFKDMRALQYFTREIETRLSTDIHNLYDGIAARIKNVEEKGHKPDDELADFKKNFPPKIAVMEVTAGSGTKAA